MSNVLNILKERGFIDNMTHHSELKDYFESGPITCYIGFDPTASSLHVGSLIPIMALAHMKRNGNKAIAVIGGGTGLIGDPSGKNKTRKSLSLDEVNINIKGIKAQLVNFTTFEGEHALILNNADWLTDINYISFIRDIGKYFSINRMVKAESYKNRLNSNEGLSFLEFNYMILQAYDFNNLYENYGCNLQLGGSDQWGNIVAGLDLVKRKNKATVFGITFPLITNSSGVKMGKTVDGAVWLDSAITSPYDYYQFWVNVDDSDLLRFMALFTFLPMEEINQLSSFDEEQINCSKIILAFETTSLAHGRKVALKTYQAAATVFGGKSIPNTIFPSSNIPREIGTRDYSSVPSVEIDKKVILSGVEAFRLFNYAGLSKSFSSARRLIEQGGGYINGKRIENPNYIVSNSNIIDDQILLRAGKKRFIKVQTI